MGTSAPTQGYDRFRRGRCPQRPGIPPPLCGPPPFHKGGCCYARSGSLVKGSWHGAAVTEGFRTPVVPLIRHGLRPCHLLPCGAKALAAPLGTLKCRWRSPHPSRLRSRWQLCCLTNAAYPLRVLTPCHLPPGEGFLFLTPGAGVGADMIRPESCPKNGIPQSASLTAPFNKGAKGRGLRIATSGFALLAMTGFFDRLGLPRRGRCPVCALGGEGPRQ